jgi:hypothetical protein
LDRSAKFIVNGALPQKSPREVGTASRLVTDKRRKGIKDSGSSDLPMSILVLGMGEKGGIEPDYIAEDCKMCTRNRAS